MCLLTPGHSQQERKAVLGDQLIGHKTVNHRGRRKRPAPARRRYPMCRHSSRIRPVGPLPLAHVAVGHVEGRMLTGRSAPARCGSTGGLVRGENERARQQEQGNVAFERRPKNSKDGRARPASLGHGDQRANLVGPLPRTARLGWAGLLELGRGSTRLLHYLWCHAHRCASHER
jgi:hypothetical protein